MQLKNRRKLSASRRRGSAHHANPPPRTKPQLGSWRCDTNENERLRAVPRETAPLGTSDASRRRNRPPEPPSNSESISTRGGGFESPPLRSGVARGSTTTSRRPSSRGWGNCGGFVEEDEEGVVREASPTDLDPQDNGAELQGLETTADKASYETLETRRSLRVPHFGPFCPVRKAAPSSSWSYGIGSAEGAQQSVDLQLSNLDARTPSFYSMEGDASALECVFRLGGIRDWFRAAANAGSNCSSDASIFTFTTRSTRTRRSPRSEQALPELAVQAIDMVHGFRGQRAAGTGVCGGPQPHISRKVCLCVHDTALLQPLAERFNRTSPGFDVSVSVLASTGIRSSWYLTLRLLIRHLTTWSRRQWHDRRYSVYDGGHHGYSALLGALARVFQYRTSRRQRRTRAVPFPGKLSTTVPQTTCAETGDKKMSSWWLDTRKRSTDQVPGGALQGTRHSSPALRFRCRRLSRPDTVASPSSHLFHPGPWERDVLWMSQMKWTGLREGDALEKMMVESKRRMRLTAVLRSGFELPLPIWKLPNTMSSRDFLNLVFVYRGPGNNRKPLIFEILPLLSPYDLVQVALTCSGARRAVNQNPKLWALARKELCDLPGPPTDIHAAGNWTEIAYARYVKKAAKAFRCALPRSCVVVGDDYLLKFRHWTVAAAILSHSVEIIGLNEWIPAWYLPTDPNTAFMPSSVTCAFNEEKAQATQVDEGFQFPTDIKLPFVPRNSEQLKLEWRRRLETWPALEQNHNLLVQWSYRYQAAVVAIQESNMGRVTDFARACGMDVGRVLGAPTLKRTLAVFARDLTLIHLQALNIIRPKIEQELALFDNHVSSFKSSRKAASTRPVKRPTAHREKINPEIVQIPCSDCSRKFKGSERKEWEEHRAQKLSPWHLCQMLFLLEIGTYIRLPWLAGTCVFQRAPSLTVRKRQCSSTLGQQAAVAVYLGASVSRLSLGAYSRLAAARAWPPRAPFFSATTLASSSVGTPQHTAMLLSKSVGATMGYIDGIFV
ncbi:hypothetical protein FB451DRAFT_1176059 [Mycena latifolia]|nr:hypothetical protein FB451DRAFT_1176059 [Mycena latifolia]